MTDLSLLWEAFTSIFNEMFFCFILDKFSLVVSHFLKSFIICSFFVSKVLFFTIKPTTFDLTLSQSESSTHLKKLHPQAYQNACVLHTFESDFSRLC